MAAAHDEKGLRRHPEGEKARKAERHGVDCNTCRRTAARPPAESVRWFARGGGRQQHVSDAAQRRNHDYEQAALRHVVLLQSADCAGRRAGAL